MNKEELFQILDYKSTELTYPFCKNCFKRVFYLDNQKKFIYVFNTLLFTFKIKKASSFKDGTAAVAKKNFYA